MNNKFQNINGIEKIDEAIIIKIVKSDPTYNDNTQRGKYSYWLLNLYINKNLKLEDLYKANEYLTSFEKNKKYLANKDIQQYHSLQDLYISLEKTEAPKLTKSQFNRQVRHIPLDDNINIKHYMSTKCYDIYIPLTYEGSIRLGKGTQWCTATEKTDEHYKSYTEKGTLYVLINKKNPKKKYLFFDKGKELADKNDEFINHVEFTIKNKNLIPFFEKFYNDKKDFEKILLGLKELSKGAVYDGEKVTCNGVTIPPSLYRFITKLIIKEGVKEINDDFNSSMERYDDYGCIYFRELNEVVFPESLRTIGDNCFTVFTLDNPKLSSIRIPKNVAKIGKNFLNGFPLKSIVVDKDNKTYDSRDNCDAIIETKTNKLIIGTANTKIPKSVTSIGHYAFWGNKSLKKIYIPDNIEKIGKYAFSECWSLKHVRFSKKIKKIEKSTFYGCHSLHLKKIPDTIEDIGEFAFFNAIDYNNFSIPKNVKTVSKFSFARSYEIEEIEKLIVPKHLESLNALSFPKSKYISVDPKNKTYDSRNNCNAIIETESNTLILGCKNTIIPQGIKGIGADAFRNCEINELTVPSSVEKIGHDAFGNCNINKLKIEGFYNAFFKHTISHCRIREIIFTRKVERLFKRTFYQCRGLRKIVLPSFLKKIDKGAFDYCDCPSSFIFMGTKKQWNAIEKDPEWFSHTDKATITISCRDGDIVEKTVQLSHYASK